MSRSAMGCLLALLGAVIANFLVIVWAFGMGAIYGCTFDQTVGHPNGGGGNYTPKFGLQGGLCTLGGLAYIYIMTLGIIPLIIAGVGALLSLGTWRYLPMLMRKVSRQRGGKR